MGNNQSNERKNWKIYRITEQTDGDNYIKICLDDYVTYKNGDYKHIFFKKGFFYRFTQLYVWCGSGTYVKIDLEQTRHVNSQHDFDICEVNGGSRDGVMKLARRVTGGTSEISANLGDIGDMLEERRNFVASIEQSRYATNPAWTKQTSWDMPPGWR